LLLHYIEGFDLSGVCAKMGLNKEAAKKRQLRALEKLRKFFARHGFATTATGIGTYLSARLIEAVPLTLERTITDALAKGATSSAVAVLVRETSRLIWWSKFKIGLSGIAIAFLLALSSGMAGAQWIFDSYSKQSPAKTYGASVTPASRQLRVRSIISEPVAATMRMRVIDAATAEPISDVGIRTLEIQETKMDEKPLTFTDTRGEASLRMPLKTNAFTGLIVGFLKQGYQQKCLFWVPLRNGPFPASYVMKLEKGNRITGVVRDEGGHPISGADIYLQFPGVAMPPGASPNWKDLDLQKIGARPEPTRLDAGPVL
jgi:hypothetical protein